MKETGIIMSGDHPGKILDGTKTMTRRTYGLEKINENPDHWIKAAPVSHTNLWRFESKDGELLIVKCPYGKVGDLLWVREAYAVRTDGVDQILYKDQYERIAELLDLPKFCKEYGFPLPMPRFKPSIHMFRKDSRLQMLTSSLRPERLQEITEEDAKAEGVPGIATHKPYPRQYRDSFEAIWDSLNAKRGYPWGPNPWVWVIEWLKYSPKNNLTGG